MGYVSAVLVVVCDVHSLEGKQIMLFLWDPHKFYKIHIIRLRTSIQYIRSTKQFSLENYLFVNDSIHIFLYDQNTKFKFAFTVNYI